jgi:hypothetical protein
MLKRSRLESGIGPNVGGRPSQDQVVFLCLDLYLASVKPLPVLPTVLPTSQVGLPRYADMDIQRSKGPAGWLVLNQRHRCGASTASGTSAETRTAAMDMLQRQTIAKSDMKTELREH